MTTWNGTKKQPGDRNRRSGQQSASDQGASQKSSGSEQEGLMSTARDAEGTMMQTAHDTIDTAKETAQQTMDMAKDAVHEMTDQTGQQAADMVSDAAEQVTQTAGELKEQATNSFTQQRDRTVQGLTALADALREAGRSMSKQQDGGKQQEMPAMIGPLVEEAADRLQQSAGFLRDKEMSGLLSEAQSLARKQPLLFMGAMFGIGIVGARLIKDATSAADGGSHDGQTGSSGTSSGQSGTGHQSSMKFESGTRDAASSTPSTAAGHSANAVDTGSADIGGPSKTMTNSVDTSAASPASTSGTTSPSARQTGNARTQPATGIADWRDTAGLRGEKSQDSFGEGLNETLPTGSAGVPSSTETPAGSEKVR
jgi:ElaB/YqjD/DUF883 family membrane-anchored ribosome-binding protein